MKYSVALITGLILVAQPLVKAQNKPVEKKSVSFAKKGDSFINLYYGLSISNAIIKGVTAISATNVNFKALGPMGVTYEYIPKDKIGVGLDLGYSKGELTYTDIYKDPASGIEQPYIVALEFTTYRIFPRFSYHFLDEENTDFYLYASGGYKRTDFVLSVGIPEARAGIKLPKLSSFGFKPGLGYRHFFNNYLGFNIELAMGTPFASAGVSFKFR